VPNQQEHNIRLNLAPPPRASPTQARVVPARRQQGRDGDRSGWRGGRPGPAETAGKIAVARSGRTGARVDVEPRATGRGVASSRTSRTLAALVSWRPAESDAGPAPPTPPPPHPFARGQRHSHGVRSGANSLAVKWPPSSRGALCSADVTPPRVQDVPRTSLLVAHQGVEYCDAGTAPGCVGRTRRPLNDDRQ